MSQSGSQHGSGRPAMRSSGPSRGGGSVYSVGQTLRKNRNTQREEIIAMKIQAIFKDKDQKMIRTIEQTITEDRLKVYKQKRSVYEEELNELEAERKRIIKKKKSKKEKNKQLKGNTRSILANIVKALNATVQQYKEQYYENDYYRYKKIMDIQSTDQLAEKKKSSAVNDQLSQFFNSPFRDDRRFVIFYLAQMTRDRVEQSKDLINHLFFDKIFNLLLKTSDEKNMLKAFEILCNLIQSTQHRKKLAKENYFRRVYSEMPLSQIDEKTLERLSWMTTLICFQPDMIEQIISLKLLAFIIKLVDPKYQPAIRSNAVLAISLLTYHEQLFDELISNGVIDLVMNLCMDVGGDINVKQFSTLALVHFALSKQSINILIQKGIMDLFNSLGIIKNVQIQTNVSWIFLALCNNGITGAQMLSNGITRDMFLVSCNPQFHQIRHLVIAGFAELGRCTDLRDNLGHHKKGSLQRIKEKAIVGMHNAFKQDAQQTIEILLRFTVSDQLKFVITAYWALKDYILLNNDCLIKDISGVISTFVNGSAQESEKIKIECANAISFLITHHIVFKEGENKPSSGKLPYEFNPNENYVLDALMLLTGSESLQVRTRAFSTLSTLSTYASVSDEIMQLIQLDTAMPPGQVSRQYHDFIKQRLHQSQEAFIDKYKTDKIEKQYAGLYCLLKLAQEPSEQAAQEAATYLHQFYYPEHYFDTIDDSQGSAMKRQLVHAITMNAKNRFNETLTLAMKQRLSVNLNTDSLDTRDIELDPLNEKFFMFVFESLLYTKNQRILYQLLDVVNFYIKHETPFQTKVIHASIILWMLKILVKYRADSELSLLAAKTILKVVDHHQIIFDYQEMAIINKFNRALDNFDGICDESNSSDEDTADSLLDEDSDQESKDNQLQNIKDCVKTQLERDLQMQISKHDLVFNDEGGNSERNIVVEQIEIVEQGLRISRQVKSDRDQSSDSHIQGPSKEVRLNATIGSDDEVSAVQKGSFAQEDHDHITQNYSEHIIREEENIDIQDISQIVRSADNSGFLDNNQRLNTNTSPIVPNKPKSLIVIEEENKQSLPRSKAEKVDSPTKSVREKNIDEIFSDKNKKKKKSKSPKKKTDRFQQDQSLRDALIKSFMVIFTNEKSQHLLLNKDIIEIAFSCLNQCEQISIDAKRNLARLISIIFKFPQVQGRILEEQIIKGVVHLLSQDQIQTQIISHAVRSCTYISLSFKFINSPLSLTLLQALTPLFDKLSDDAVQKQYVSNVAQETYRPENRSEKDNCLFAISNLLKGSSQNCQYFIRNDGPRKVMQQMLKLLDSNVNADKIMVIELCVSSIKQISNRKENFKEFLNFSDINRSFLTQCLRRCFIISSEWHKSTTELLRFRKLINQIKKTKVDVKRHDTDAIMNLDYKNAESFKALEILEAQDDLSVKMANLVKIRNNIYFTAVGCLKQQFQVDFLIDQCGLLSNLMEDLQRDELNDYLFQHLILCLQSLQKSNETIMTLLKLFGNKLFKLFESIISMEKKIIIMKTVIQLVIRVPEEICSLDAEIFGNLFKYAVNQKFDDEEQSNDIKESVLWLQTTLLELNHSESQQEKAIQITMQFKTAEIFIACLKSENEQILLQSLKGLAAMAKIPEFRPTLLIDNGDKLFAALQDIAFKKIQNFQRLGLNLEVTICSVLALITTSKNQKDPLTASARRKVVAQGFVDYFLARSAEFDYKVLDEQQELIGISQIQENAKDQSASIFEIEITQHQQQSGIHISLEDYDQAQLGNSIVEQTMFLVANVTELPEIHYSLVKNAGKLLVYMVQIAQQLFQYAQSNGGEQLEMNSLTFGNLQLGQHISSIVYNLVSVSSGLEQNVNVQEICMKSGFGVFVIQLSQMLVDYEMHINLFKAMESMLLSQNQNVVKNAIDQGCLQEVMTSADESRFFKVRRICSAVCESATESMNQQNQSFLKNQRAQKKQKQ